MERNFSTMSSDELDYEFLAWGHTVLFYRRRVGALEAVTVATVEHAKRLNRARTRLGHAEVQLARVEEEKTRRQKRAA
jgi:hypothetical protein